MMFVSLCLPAGNAANPSGKCEARNPRCGTCADDDADGDGRRDDLFNRNKRLRDRERTCWNTVRHQRAFIAPLCRGRLGGAASSGAEEGPPPGRGGGLHRAEEGAPTGQRRGPPPGRGGGLHRAEEGAPPGRGGAPTGPRSRSGSWSRRPVMLTHSLTPQTNLHLNVHLAGAFIQRDLQ